MLRLSALSVALLLGLSVAARAQDSTLVTHAVPFGLAENRLTLTVANTAATSAARLTVRPIGAPDWLHLTPTEIVLDEVASGAEQPARFSFQIDPAAPVGTPVEVTFTVEGTGGERWTKRVRLQVAAPERVRLLPAAPNPFNPETRLGYELPTSSRVRLAIYNSLGQQVARLVDEVQSAGGHKATFSGSGLPSGLYIARLTVEAAGRATAVEHRRMLLLK